MGYVSDLIYKASKVSKGIVPSSMDEGYEIHSREYAKRHTDIAFEYDNSPIFNKASNIAESMKMGELNEFIDMLVDLYDARKETSRKID